MKKSRLLTALFIVASALILTGCNSWRKQDPQVATPIQANLLQKCQPLSEVTGATGADVLTTMIDWAGQYNTCAATHNGLVDAVKKDVPR